MQVINILKPKFPEARWGYRAFRPAYTDAFLDGSAAAANACDWIGVHATGSNHRSTTFPMNGDMPLLLARQVQTRFPNKI